MHMRSLHTHSMSTAITKVSCAITKASTAITVSQLGLLKQPWAYVHTAHKAARFQRDVKLPEAEEA